MCGIFGIFQYQRRPVDDLQDKLDKAVELLQHRGPDDHGTFISPNSCLGLAHTRLSIIDIAGGHQPLSNEDDSIWIVFNGQIYNYRDLRRRLTAEGHVFKTDTDTEIIVHLYESKGRRCLDDLRGMFAFALWDAKKGHLFCARDRLGQKPFLYAIDSGTFYLSSEIQPLLRSALISKALSETALLQCLNVFLPVAPHSMFKAIHKLTPATAMIVDESGPRRYTYWRPEYMPKFRETEDELADRLEALVEESVRLRLMSEVPLGSMLSGGLDSSIVSFFAQKHSSKRLQTFGAFHKDEQARDVDWRYVNRAAEAIGSDHHHIFYDESGLLDMVPRMVAAFGEPYASINGPVSLTLAERIRRHVTVALSGNGGDEVFAGYDTYRKTKLLNAAPVQALLNIPSERLMAIYADRWRHEDLERSFKKWFWLYPLTLPADQRSGYVTAPLSY